MKATLPLDASARKRIPLASGLLYYFPAALAAVAELSRIGNEQHNPGQPLHHARGKSTDHADTILRHQMDAGIVDADGVRHSTKVAWRALAQLQEELEREEGAPLPRGARLPASCVESIIKAGIAIPHTVAAAAMRDHASTDADVADLAPLETPGTVPLGD